MNRLARRPFSGLSGLLCLLFAVSLTSSFSTKSVASELIDATRAGDAERVARLLTDTGCFY